MNPTVSLAPSGNILLTIPSVLAEGRSHSVEIPQTLAGLSLLKKILVERSRDPTPSIGRKSAPVAADIAKFLNDRAREEAAALSDRFGGISLDL